MALALAFDVEMPFSKIRSQATNLARSLATQPPTTEPLPTSPPHEEASQPERPATQAEYDEEDFPIDISSLKPLFDDVPPPTPSPVRLAAPTTPPATIETKQDQPSPLPDNGFSLEKSPAIRMETFPTVEQCASPLPETPPLEEVTSMIEDEALSETRPHVVIDSDMGAGLQPISPAVCSLNYTCLLIPRLPKHHLTGDLADRLSEWVPQLCLAFGWRLEQLSVRPDYLQWTVNVPPSTSPSYLMRILRQHSSEHIFADFSALGRENPSGDFWAPGYLIMSSLQPPPAQIIKDFIKKTRRHQGVSKSKFTVA
jgi:REP element-mobilizing transposase RayT